ncbi:MAG: transcription-repair coupling factor [Prolixibacteraceae bacterium]|nr:transcription-repair coupling factor [Prolixibacteraceae bacterium]
MDLKEFKQQFSKSENFQTVLTELKQGENKIHIKGLTGSSKTIYGSVLAEQVKHPILFILNNREDASYFYDDLVNLKTGTPLFFFPSSYKRVLQYDSPDQENIILRTEVLHNLKNKKDLTMVSYPEAISEKVITAEGLSSNTFPVKIGDKLSIEFLNDMLFEYGFEQVDFVIAPGQYSIRGSIIDIFSFSGKDPYRLDLLGDQIDTIRTFDIDDQTSREKIDQIVIIPNIQTENKEEKREDFLNFLPKGTIIVIQEISLVSDTIGSFIKKINEKEGNLTDVKQMITDKEDFLKGLENRTILQTGSNDFYLSSVTVLFHTQPQPVFHKNFELLSTDLQKKENEGYNNFILSSTEKQIERLRSIFKDQKQDVKFTGLCHTLNEGFIEKDLRISCYTDHQIFERYHRFKTDNHQEEKEKITIRELGKLHPGDYVVHIDHGIGKFTGLVKTEMNGKMQEVIRLLYKNNDVLLVSIHSLHRLSKYKGKDGIEPKISKLGGGAWQKLKDRTKKKVKDIARELIALYAKRKEEKGFAFSPDTYMQKELEASFIFEDTPDQEKATQSFKEDMESNMPMDRLICGDVGFGKTEIAIRAAFKAVADNKQVAILVPTTILALQHYRTFSERLKDFPANIEYVSRLKSPKEIKDIIKKTKEGKVDILIGTHRLIGKDVGFKDLGLLVVDEEQKFGVSVKEKLKRLKVNVDTLTMTATPIPRTLQFSLMGARDLSIIQTPPPNRYPIITEVQTLNEEIIKNAINYEIARNGQVFFINNRIQNIYEIENFINKIVPGAKTKVAHGQMEGPKLEKIILDFINGEYDVLISTTIVESGLDIPNANTIFINHAENFGLSDLHQLRGRVGRSNKKAFCYLLAPPLATLTSEACRRLQAIEEFSDLGCGFNIAMRDLDIRGAGNLLGAEQSGFIANIGFETYHRILDEAINELKQDEYKDLYKEEEEKSGKQLNYVNDCQVDTELELLFPDSYIQSVSERMLLYRQLDNIQDEESLKQYRLNLTDRFGELPKQSQELLEVVHLRWLAIELGIERIILKNKKMICFFISDQKSSYYQTPVFSNFLKYIQIHADKCKIKEKKEKLRMSINSIETIDEAKKALSEIKNIS